MENATTNRMTLCRKTQFKKCVTAEEGRRRRDIVTLSIRKGKKELQLKKKRGAGLLGDISTVSDLKTILSSSDQSEKDIIYATQCIRRLSSSSNDLHIQEILNDGIIPILVQNLRRNTHIVIYESAWALTNISSTNCSMEVVKAGAIEPLVGLLEHKEDSVREQAAWCLGNIAGEGSDLRDRVLYGSALTPLLLNVANPAHQSLLGIVVWTISNLCRGRPSPSFALTADAMHPLVSLLDRPVTEEIIVDVLWALSYLSGGDNKTMELLFSSGVTHKLIKLLEYNIPRYNKMIIRILGKFASRSECYTQSVIDSGLLDHLAGLMVCQSREVRKEASWLASNIACGNHEQITKLIRKKNVVQQLVENAMQDSWGVRQETIWALANVCTWGNQTHVLSLVYAGGLEPLVAILAFENVDLSLLLAVLNAIRNVLDVHHRHLCLFEEYDGIEYLEQLQTHPNEVVYEKVINLIQEFFGVADEEDENLAPQTNENDSFSYGISCLTKRSFDGFQQLQQQQANTL